VFSNTFAAPRLCFRQAFGRVRIGIDELEVWCSPERKHRGPFVVASFVPYPMQRYAMVNFGPASESLTRLGTTAELQPLQELNVRARSSPEPPGGNAGSVPFDLSVRTGAPEIDMPAEAIDGLAADTAAAATQLELGFTIGSWRSTEAVARAMLAVTGHGPGPARRSSSLGGEGTGQVICADRMGTPIGIDCKPRQWRDQRTAERVDQHWYWEDLWQSPLEALEGSPILFSAPFRTRHNPSFPTFRTEIIEQGGKRFMDAGIRRRAVFTAEGGPGNQRARSILFALAENQFGQIARIPASMKGIGAPT
jgi:hypothetical protein